MLGFDYKTEEYHARLILDLEYHNDKFSSVEICIGAFCIMAVMLAFILALNHKVAYSSIEDDNIVTPSLSQQIMMFSRR